MVSSINISKMTEKMEEAFKKLPNDVPDNLIVKGLYNQMYIHRYAKVEDEDLIIEDPLIDQFYGGGKIYICRSWSLDSESGILNFKDWLADKSKNNIAEVKLVIPDFVKGYYSPKTSKIVTSKLYDKFDAITRININNLTNLLSKVTKVK